MLMFTKFSVSGVRNGSSKFEGGAEVGGGFYKIEYRTCT